jgi:hypothetical protein
MTEGHTVASVDRLIHLAAAARALLVALATSAAFALPLCLSSSGRLAAEHECQKEPMKYK